MRDSFFPKKSVHVSKTGDDRYPSGPEHGVSEQKYDDIRHSGTEHGVSEQKYDDIRHSGGVQASSYAGGSMTKKYEHQNYQKSSGSSGLTWRFRNVLNRQAEVNTKKGISHGIKYHDVPEGHNHQSFRI